MKDRETNIDLVIQCVTKKYVNFSERARRKEYWLYTLCYTIVYTIIMYIDVSVGTISETGIGTISSIFAIAMLLPSLGVLVRSLHDTNRSGWWILILLIPLVGIIWMIVLCCLQGTSGRNRFGEDPLET